ncbi:MAG TPA: alpha/beta hydrolase [Pseudonocardiaceae bacterium]
MRAESIVVNGSRISYWHNTTGSRDTALLLHGLGGDHRGLAEVAAGLTDVDVVIPDVPGYGDSAPLTQPHTLANYAASIEALRVALDLGPVHLIGHSLGASIALLHASTYPAALRSLSLLNPVSTANNVTANLGKLYYRVAAALPARAARFWLASKPAVYIADAMIIVSKDKAVRRRILDEDYENYARASVPAMIESFLSYYDTNFEQRAAHITADTLLLTGGADRIAPVASVTALAKAIPSAQLSVLPGAGHLVPMETPADVIVPLATFLRDRCGRTVTDPTESV